MRGPIIKKLHRRFIEGTPKGALVPITTTFLCNIIPQIQKVVGFSDTKVNINTKVIKHLYDKRTPEDYELIIKYLHSVIMYPNVVYEDKEGKRGDFCFIKRRKRIILFCSLEKTKKHSEVVTAFRIRKEKVNSYLSGYKRLWGSL